MLVEAPASMFHSCHQVVSIKNLGDGFQDSEQPQTAVYSVCACMSVCSVVLKRCNPHDYSLPDSSVIPGILRQSCTGGLPLPAPGRRSFHDRDRNSSPQSPALAGSFFITEPPGKRIAWKAFVLASEAWIHLMVGKTLMKKFKTRITAAS